MVLIAVLALASQLRGQDLFDSLNAGRYADFLFRSANYQEALAEYERLVFLFNSGEEIKLRLVQSYRLAGKPELALQRAEMLWAEPTNVSERVSKELFALKIITGNTHNLALQANNNQWLLPEEKTFFIASTQLLGNDYQKAAELLNSVVIDENSALAAYRNIANDALTQKYKSPFAAGLFSAIIPGTGKFYAGNWQDGLLSMSIIGVTAWQAYRGFEKRGVRSVYGWIYGIIGTGFYLGNIFGSVKEINRYNQAKHHRIHIRVEAVFYNNL